MASEQYDITITNYDKFKGRSDVTHNSWFRLSNRFLEDPDFFDFSGNEKLTWIYILSLGSQKNESTFKLNIKHAEKVCGLNKHEVHSALKKLSEIKCISYDVTSAVRAQEVTSDPRALHNSTEQDITVHNKQDITKHAEPQNAVTVASKKTEIQISENKSVEIKSDLITAWANTYPKEYLELEIKKARNWLIANSHKAPKTNFGKFFNAWFDRGWETYRKNLPSNQSKTSVDELMQMMGWDNA